MSWPGLSWKRRICVGRMELVEMKWSKPLRDCDYDYYELTTFVLVNESHEAIRIKLIDKYREEYNGLVFWMPKSLAKDYNDSNPNIKTAWLCCELFYKNIYKALDYLDEKNKEALKYLKKTDEKK